MSLLVMPGVVVGRCGASLGAPGAVGQVVAAGDRASASLAGVTRLTVSRPRARLPVAARHRLGLFAGSARGLRGFRPCLAPPVVPVGDDLPGRFAPAQAEGQPE